jgi:FkbM family methyltransferase
MLIPCSELSLVYGDHPHGILHVGAHDAEELESYHSYGWGPVIWVEMLPEKFEHLKQRFEGDSNNTVMHAACWDSDGDNLPLFRASNNGASSSLLSPQLHLVVHPQVSFVEEEGIRTSRLDSILPKDASFDLINFDIQGAELRALRGLGEFLDRVKWAYLEINERPPLYGLRTAPGTRCLFTRATICEDRHTHVRSSRMGRGPVYEHKPFVRMVFAVAQIADEDMVVVATIAFTCERVAPQGDEAKVSYFP